MELEAAVLSDSAVGGGIFNRIQDSQETPYRSETFKQNYAFDVDDGIDAVEQFRRAADDDIMDTSHFEAQIPN